MRGYSGRDGLFHSNVACRLLDGRVSEIRALPLAKALKWDVNLCPECFPDEVSSESR